MALAPVELRRAACAAAAVQHGVRGPVSMASPFTPDRSFWAPKIQMPLGARLSKPSPRRTRAPAKAASDQSAAVGLNQTSATKLAPCPGNEDHLTAGDLQRSLQA